MLALAGAASGVAASALGRRTMRLTRQSEGAQHAKFRENVRWSYGEVLFVMLAGLGIESPETKRATGFDDFLAALEKEPLFGSTSRRSIENFTRVETVGYPDTHWVRAIVDPREPQLFSFRQEIVKENLVDHGVVGQFGRNDENR
jgi:hypothetical protein